MEFIYQTGWGAFTILLVFQLPFLLVFYGSSVERGYVDTSPGTTSDEKVSKLKNGWIALVIALFLVVNLASISYIPAVYTAEAARRIWTRSM